MMKPLNNVLLAAAITAATAGAAHATPLLSIQASSGGSTLSNSASANAGGQAGTGVSGSLGVFSFTFNAGTSTTLPSENLVSSNVTSGGSGTLTVKLSESNLSGPAGISGWLSNIGSSIATSSADFTLKTYADTSNTVYGTGILLSSLSGTGVFSESSLANALLPAGMYSITEILTITVNSAVQNVGATASLAAASVPEPSTIALLGAGLIGIGLIRRRARA